MAIRVICPNGHSLNVKEKYAGRIGLCPECQAQVEVPRRAISDSSVIAILGEHIGQDSPAEKVGVKSGTNKLPCPRCHAFLSKNNRACPHCHLYLPLAWQQQKS
jgi:uncharacterized paraquat-inducible protein A